MSLALCLSLWFANVGIAQETATETDPLESAVDAPPNMRRLGEAPGGWYFVDADLLDRYESLKARLSGVREEIAQREISSGDALKSLTAIQEESQRLRAELEEKKVLVSAFQVFSQTSEETFPLGKERLVIVTGDDVVIRGWEGPGIKCVVEKTILAKQMPDAAEFDAIKIDHKLTVAKQMVGLTREEHDRQEREFLESEEGRKLTDEQRQNRHRFVEEIHHSFDDFLAFQGREADVVQLTGLSYEDGNRSLSLRVNSPGGEGNLSSKWQRHAVMTVYVPPCKSLAARGCLAGLDVQNVECDLLLTTQGSKDRAYAGSFTVNGVKGNVTIAQVPVRALSEVTGNVRFTATNEFVNSGTRHENGMRTFSVYETQPTTIDHIGGELQATFLRTDLTLDSIDGTLDVVNRYGTTHLTVSTADTDRTQRVISESGTIRVDGPEDVLRKTPIYAYTECGRLQTNLSRDVLDDFNFSTGNPQREWHGLITPSKDRFDVTRFERPMAVIENRERSAGLDLISHAGMVSILMTDASE